MFQRNQISGEADSVIDTSDISASGIDSSDVSSIVNVENEETLHLQNKGHLNICYAILFFLTFAFSSAILYSNTMQKTLVEHLFSGLSIKIFGEDFYELDPSDLDRIEDIRTQMAALTSSNDSESQIPMKNVFNLKYSAVGGKKNRIRILVPYSSNEEDTGAKPVVVYFHSGGMFFGAIESEETQARTFAQFSEFIVVVVEYRLAPEHQHPIGVKDALAGSVWVKNNIKKYGGDPNKISLVGQSSGGYLAITSALQKPELFCSIIPVTPMLDPTVNFPSMVAQPIGKSFARKYWEMYLGPDLELKVANDYLANPFLVEKKMSLLNKFPPTLLISVESDIYRDETESFAELLKHNTVEVETIRYNRTMHGFFAVGFPLPHGMAALEQTSLFIQKHCFD
mmetsp:Transcript_11829/g.15459  ORF Transcript_11829/g.15459 Transcript_11829/m.15459 type:complete len:397 (-) Transcript_11829:217-1407(-)